MIYFSTEEKIRTTLLKRIDNLHIETNNNFYLYKFKDSLTVEMVKV